MNDGTKTNEYVPIYGYYADEISKSQFIIPASALADMAWGTISKMTFYAQADKNWGAAQFEVYMTETSETTLSSLADYGTMTKVKNAGSLSISGNVMEVTLDDPYQYMDGNLMIGFLQTVSGTYKRCSWYGVSATGASLGGYNNSIDQQNFLPKTTFTYEPANTDCPKPKNLAASNVTAHTAELSWESDGTAFILQYKKATDSNWTEKKLEVNENPYTLTGLAPETEYQVRVQAHSEGCGQDPETGEDIFSDYREITFTTGIACFAPTNLAVTDGSITARNASVTWEGTSDSYVVMIGQENLAIRADFEDQAIPADFNNSDVRPWRVTAGGANGSGYCAIPGNQGANSSECDLTLEVTLDRPATVSFNAKVSSESGYDWGRFLIDGTQMMQTSGNQDWTAYSYELTAGTHTLKWRYYKDSSAASNDDLFYVDDIVVSAGVDSWTEYTTNAQTYTFENLTPGTPYQVKVKGNCGNEGYSQETTPVRFTTLELYARPTGLAVAEVGPKTAVLSWTENGEATAWEICLNNDEENLITAGSNPFTLTGLTPETAYTAKVRACYDADAKSNWSSKVNFFTLVACPKPTNLSVTNVTHNSATINWTGYGDAYDLRYAVMPESRDNAYLQYSTEVLDGGVGTDGGAVYWGIRFPAADLAAYAGQILTQVGVFTDSDGDNGYTYSGNYTVRVYQGGDTAPETLVSEATEYLPGDFAWHDITLPFDLVLEGSPLEGATAKTLTNATVTNNGEYTHVELTFGDDVTTLQAGKPYIIKWEASQENIENPTSTGVLVKDVDEEVRTLSFADYQVQFIGYYDAFNITPEDEDIFYMTAGSELKHTGQNRTLKSCRAYFQFSEEALKARQFVLNFGDGNEATGIVSATNFSKDTNAGWYTVDGMKLGKQPTRKGVYIHNGRKAVIK